MERLEYEAKFAKFALSENRHGEPVATVTLKITGELGEEFPGLNRLIGSKINATFSESAKKSEPF